MDIGIICPRTHVAYYRGWLAEPSKHKAISLKYFGKAPVHPNIKPEAQGVWMESEIWILGVFNVKEAERQLDLLINLWSGKNPADWQYRRTKD